METPPGWCAAPQTAADSEKQEFKIAVEALRQENAKLRKMDGARQRELAIATNRLARLEIRQSDARSGMVADDEEVRSAGEWRAFLLNALKILAETDREMQALQKRLRQLQFAAQQAFKSAERVDPAKRALLEAELRQAEKVLAGKEEPRPRGVLTATDSTPPSSAKVIGVRLDLGVAALGIGRKHGARVGMPFLVQRGKTVLAALTLAEVRENAALAIIEQMDPDRPIREGDAAVLRKM
ncbi:MAG: hypothetical protein HY360_22135 [Verrucomicrobia bacterium]|nr:hypothetical protein [Verrucomicrobiota bacterium]